MEESSQVRDREMLEHVHLHFWRKPGMPRSWEEFPRRTKEQVRRRHWARRRVTPKESRELTEHALRSR